MTKQEIKKFLADYLFEEMEFSYDEDFKDSVVGELDDIDVSCALAGGGGIYTMRGKSEWFNYCRPVPKKVTRDMTSLKKKCDELKARAEFLDDALDLILLDTKQDMTTARQEIEEEYGNDYFKKEQS